MENKPHPEQGYRSCLGLIRLGDRYGKERLENACARALFYGTTSYKSVNSILKHGLDSKLPTEKPHLSLLFTRISVALITTAQVVNFYVNSPDGGKTKSDAFRRHG
jgi:hypothetical protein